MARVNQAEVLTVSGLNDAAVFGAAVNSAIVVATTLVNDLLLGQNFNAAKLKSIELYLACHFSLLSAEKGPLAAVDVGDATERYHNVYSAGLNSTRFGQQAIVLDTSGKLAAVSAKAMKPTLEALFASVGTGRIGW